MLDVGPLYQATKSSQQLKGFPWLCQRALHLGNGTGNPQVYFSCTCTCTHEHHTCTGMGMVLLQVSAGCSWLVVGFGMNMHFDNPITLVYTKLIYNKQTCPCLHLQWERGWWWWLLSSRTRWEAREGVPVVAEPTISLCCPIIFVLSCHCCQWLELVPIKLC